MKLYRFIAALLLSCAWASAYGLTVGLNPPHQNVPPGLPFYQAVPIAKGELLLKPGERLRSNNDTGAWASASAATFWPDGSVQWLKVDGLVNAGQRGEPLTRMEFAPARTSNASVGQPLVKDVVLNAGAIELRGERGVLLFTLKPTASMVRVTLPMRATEADPDFIDKEGQYMWAAPIKALSDNTSKVALKMQALKLSPSADSNEKTAWVVRGTGVANEVAGRLEWQLRVETIAGSPTVRVSATWSAFWDEQQWALAGASLAIAPSHPLETYAFAGGDAEPVGKDSSFSNTPKGDKLGVNKRAERLKRADDWFLLGGKSFWLGVALPDFARLGPNRVDVSRAGALIHCWDPESGLALDLRKTGNENEFMMDPVDARSGPEGLSRTVDIWLVLGQKREDVGALADALAVRDNLWFPDSASVLATGAFGPILAEAVDLSSPYLQGLRANLRFLKSSREHWKWYGFINYGDVRTNFAYQRSEKRELYPLRWALSGRYGWRNAAGDVPYGLLKAAVLLNDRELSLMGLDYARHIADVDMVESAQFGPASADSGGAHRRNRDHWSGSVQLQYSPGNGLYLGYWLSGEPRLEEALAALRNYAQRKGGETSIFAAQAWINRYRETHKDADLATAEKLLDQNAAWWESRPNVKERGRAALYSGNFRWMSDAVTTLIIFHEATGRKDYLAQIEQVLERERSGEHGRFSHVLQNEAVMGYLIGSGIPAERLGVQRLQSARENIVTMAPSSLPHQDEWDYESLVDIVTHILPGAPTPEYRESNAIGKRAANSFLSLNLLSPIAEPGSGN